MLKYSLRSSRVVPSEVERMFYDNLADLRGIKFGDFGYLILPINSYLRLMKILIIEDKPELAQNIADYLSAQNYLCEFASILNSFFS
jgi:hypothetical protein